MYLVSTVFLFLDTTAAVNYYDYFIYLFIYFHDTMRGKCYIKILSSWPPNSNVVNLKTNNLFTA